MADIKPFKGFRPNSNVVKYVSALPYDVVSSKEAREIVENNKYSFLKVDRAEVNLNIDVDIYSEEVYKEAKKQLDDMINNNIFIKEQKEVFYIYKQCSEENTQIGLVSTVSVDDYLNNVIKKHEKTRYIKELDRINHIDYCNAHTGPIFIMYKENIEINNLINESMKKNPIYSFQTDDNIKHTVWIIDEKDKIEMIVNKFKNINSLYIADGHHRSEAAVKVALKRRNSKINDSSDRFLGVLYPSNSLKILDYNRVVSDLNNLTIDEFINSLKNNFKVSKSDIEVKPYKKHMFGMYLEKQWYKLELREDVKLKSKDSISNLDVSILQDYILNPILNIKDIKNSDKIEFVGGIKGLKELEKKVDSYMKVAFSIYPTSVSEIMKVSDEGNVMPPKSTWFEPKIRSGLFIHKI